MKIFFLMYIFLIFFVDSVFASQFQLGDNKPLFNDSKVEIKNKTKNENKFTKNSVFNLHTPENLQMYFDNFVANEGTSLQVSALPFTFQCKTFNNSSAFSILSGKYSSQGAAITRDALFQIGSMSKSFVSVVLLQLESEGKLGKNGIDSFVGNYLSGYEKWQNITIKQLLNMTSGIRDYANDDHFLLSMHNSNPYYKISIDEILHIEKDQDLLFVPGTAWRYSNTNYIIAAKIIEIVTGNSIKNEITSRIIKPLNLAHMFYIENSPYEEIESINHPFIMSGVFVQGEQQIVSLTSPYYSSGIYIERYSLSWLNAAGSMISNTEDMNTYIRQLFKPREFGGKIVTLAQVAKLLSLVSTSTGQPIEKVDSLNQEAYGLGIGSRFDSMLQTSYYFHKGATLGFLSQWIFFPKEEVSLVGVFNSNNSKINEVAGMKIYLPLMSFISENCN